MKNTELLESEVNVTFDDILNMSITEFQSWCLRLRVKVVDLWDNKGLPPRVGFTEEEAIDQFQQMMGFPVFKFEVKDELTGNKDVIRNTHVLGNAVNDWFPTMMKTRINYSKDPDAGKSIYDFFAKDELAQTFFTYARRHFKRDSFYHYSQPVPVSHEYGSGKEYVEQFNFKGDYGFWFNPVEKDVEYTGYNDDLRGKKYLIITRKEIYDLYGISATKPTVAFDNRALSNIDYLQEPQTDNDSFQIRLYKKGQKVFPIGLKAFRVSFCQYAVNFPPLTAKYLYDRYTEDFITDNNEPIIVWDPSAGWGGRLVGALTANIDRKLIYLANDPNTDHNVEGIVNGKQKTKYHEIYDFIRHNTQRGGIFPVDHNNFDFWQLGSEDMQFDPDFQRFKGKVSVVFTSPPYFSKEAYSEDNTQSYKRFSRYDSWRDGFLYETLRTAHDWLRVGGYILWNVADATFGGERLPIEADSCKIMSDLGMKHVETLKMSLSQMPGGNRVDTITGLPKAKNYVKVNGIWLKYEPIYVYRKEN